MNLVLGGRGRCVMSPGVDEKYKMKEGQMEGLQHSSTLSFKPE